MRILRLEVRDFACVRCAALDLAAGLNVLYGPNDLGKSSLATALRAVLLVPTSSSTAKEWVSWTGDESPFVELTFQTDQRRFWRVRKSFGTGAKGAAILEKSSDGEQFAVHSKGRQVDGDLREILAWGIPGPGGKGAPRGLPESFLSAALLGRQDGVGEIFARDLDADPDATGKELLMGALQKLGEDPLVKKIQARAQEKVDEAFTARGAKKSGKNAPFARSREKIRQAEQRVRELGEQVAAGKQVGERLKELRERRWTLESQAEQARERFERADAASVRADKERELRRIDDLTTAIAEDERLEAELDESLRRIDADVIAAGKARLEAERVADRAEKKLRDLREGEAEARRRLRRGEIETRRLEIEKIEDRRHRLVELQEALDDAEEQKERAEQMRRRALEMREQAESSGDIEVDLPSDEELADLRRLREEKRVLEAKLDVGLSIDLHPLRPLDVEFSRDGEAPQSASLALRTTLEAKGSVKLILDGVAELRVRGGTQDLREQIDEIDDAWRRRVVPHLERAGAGTLEELEASVRAAEKKRGEVERLRRDAESLQEQAQDAARRAAKIEPLRADIEQLRTDLGDELSADLDELSRERSILDEEFSELSGGDSPDLTAAQEALAAAREASDQAKENENKRRRERDEARLALERRRAELELRRKQQSESDPSTRERLVRELEALGDEDASAAASIDVEESRRRFEQTRDALARLDADLRGEEGALRQVGGEIAEEKLKNAQEALSNLRDQEIELERDYGAWRLLLQTLQDAEREQSNHLGQALIGPVSEGFQELTRGRYGRFRLGPNLETLGIDAAGESRGVDALSVGTRDQLASLLRLTLAERLGSVLVLDDQLVHSDADRREWFRGLLLQQAHKHQIVIFTCRPEEYLQAPEIPDDQPWRDVRDGRLRAVDLERVIERG